MTRRLQVLFLAAAAGVLLALGLLAYALGWVALGAYALLLVVAAGLVVRQARRRERDSAPHACSCCAGAQHDPVEVV